MDGTVVSVYVEDFVTYRKVKFVAGHNLNVIIGPNGTGKSTLLCAILLGLGGKPKHIGRMANANAYIRTSCNSAIIEVELACSNGPNCVIRRVIHNDNKSQYQINGASATQKQVDEVVRKMNIQVDNLLQFLPQDRVADFSKMNAQELLENTEKCIGTEEMIKQHEELKQLHKQYVERERSMNAVSSRLSDEEQRNSRISVDVENIAEKRNMLQMIEKLKQKRAWLHYDIYRKKVYEAVNDKKKSKESVEKHERAYAPMGKLITATANKIREIEGRISNMSPAVNKKLSALNDRLDDLERIENEIKVNIDICERKIRDDEERQGSINSLMQSISKLENDLRNLNIEPESVLNDLTRQMQEKLTVIRNLTATRESHQTQLESISNEMRANEERQNSVKDVSAQRMNLLRRIDKHAHDAVVWLRANKHRFKERVYEPMMLEINVPMRENAKYVEAAVARRDLVAFTFEDKSDMTLFLKVCREEMNLRVNALHSGAEHPPSSSFKPTIPINQIRQYGFHTYLSDMLEGPETIIKYLYRLFGIYNIPVGNSYTHQIFETIPDNISTYFSDNYSFFSKRSKYTHKKLTSTNSIHPPNLLALVLNSQMLKELEESYQALQQEKITKMKKLEALQAEIYRAESELAGLRERRNKIRNDKEMEATVRSKIQRKKEELAKKTNMKIDPKVERALLKQKNQVLTLQLCEKVVQLVTLQKEYDEINQEHKTLQLELDVLRVEKIDKENESRDLLQKISDAKILLQNIDEVIRSRKNEAMRLFEIAKEQTGGVTPKDPKFNAYKASFNILPDTEEELDKDIQETQAKADCLGIADEGVMYEYEARNKTISELKITVKKKEEELKKLKETMDNIRNEWLPPLKKLIAAINEKFGECFARLQCAGEIVLVTGENQDDYSEYGLRIKVKFRDGDQLQELTHQTQSGGERAVSTAIYLIALQEFIKVPFCCVDEINQGMDRVNDQKIFQLLLSSTKVSGVQYFLLTPKLLPSLFYEDTTVVHCVYNGTGLLEKNKYHDISKYAQIARRLHEQTA